MKTGLLKGLGIAASILGVGATLLNDMVQEKMLDKKVAEKVNEALKNR